jgi:aldehyde dehydrogenase (NAD+)
MTAIANSIRIGDPQEDDTQMGPLCTRAQISHIETQVARAVEQGGRVITGGKAVADRDGLFFQPTIIECPDPDMDIVDTELFGPVLVVLRFTEEDDVVVQANNSVHGLAAGIFTRDSARSMRMARRIRAGIVWVNTYRVISPIAEFGGSKQSGYGRESGMQAVYDYTRPKTIWMNLSDEPIANPFEPR